MFEWRRGVFAAILTGLAVVATMPFGMSADARDPISVKTTKPLPAPARRPVVAPRRAPLAMPANPAVTGRDAMLLIDAETGRELEAVAADEPRHPASLTKLMTLYLAFEALDSGRFKPADPLPVSAAAGAVQPSKMDAPVGGTVAARDAVMGLVTRSANDAAVVLAEAIAGDEASFARAMTQKARQLGMISTTFRNAHGLPDPAQITTARDLAKLAQALMRDFPHYYPLFAIRDHLYAGRILRNHNQMLGWYPGADGLKTGYINASGFNLVMSALRGERRLIGVVFGGTSPGERDATMADMMDRGFERAQTLRLAAWRPSAVSPQGQRNAAAIGAKGHAGEPSPRLAGTPPRGAVSPYEAENNPMQTIVAPQSLPPSRWALNIGSFANSQSASAALRKAAGLLPEIKGQARPTIDPVTQAGRTIFRARLANLDEARAVKACRKLEANHMNCAPVAN